MSFLFPMFLLTGLALAIPVFIHLFNLRRYKRINFPDNRFLKDIFLSTRQQAKIRDRRLLLSRLLFLAALILAFAQPFLKSKDAAGAAVVTAIYIDNSYSMGLTKGQQNLLQQSIADAKSLIAASGPNRHFLMLTNDHPSATRPMPQNEALEYLQQIRPTARLVSMRQIVQAVTAAHDDEQAGRWDLYIFSDLQKNTFVTEEKISIPKQISCYICPVQEPGIPNLFIDTAYFLSPGMDMRKPNEFVVVARKSGGNEPVQSSLSVTVDGQMRAMSAISFSKDSQVWTDTLSLQPDGRGWQHIAVSLQDHPMSFDDTFRIAARTNPDLSVLIINNGGVNPYLQSSLGAQEGFQVRQESIAQMNPGDWKNYSLIILQNITGLSVLLTDAINAAMERGQSVLLFPGIITDVPAFNASLSRIGAITLGRMDTTQQQVVSLQDAHPLLQDLFEKIPENVQLPVSLQRYPIDAAIAANQQSLMSFKDGRPFLAQYTLKNGRLFLCASPLDQKAGNFAVSYYFVPVLYKMAVQSGGNNMYAVNVGSDEPVWLPSHGISERQVWRMIKDNFEVVPPQRPDGNGVAVFAGKSALEAGFYFLQNEASPDTSVVALNTNRLESLLESASQKDIEKLLNPAKVNWIDQATITSGGWGKVKSPFPLWKMAVILAFAGLVLETFLLLRKKRSAADVTVASA